MRLSRKEHGDVGDGQNSLQLITYGSQAGEKGEGNMGYAIWDVSHGIGDKPRGMGALSYAIGQTRQSHKRKSVEKIRGSA
ncbi:MAG: hypothetical protein JRF50_00210 [Deltaproteobacteria bacterium]|nr:hypothetical protein [Deltaproteobacteria bacterium]